MQPRMEHMGLQSVQKPVAAQKEKDFALVEAAKRGDTTGVDKLIKSGASIQPDAPVGGVRCHHKIHSSLLMVADDSGLLPLVEAVRGGHVHATEVLLKAGCDANMTDSWGRSPLGCAVMQGYSAICKMLLQYGADTNKDIRKPPLTIASKNGYVKIVHLLIEAGANVTQMNEFGQPSLVLALSNGHVDVVEALLDASADVNQVDDYFLTPLCYAVFEKDIRSAKMLLAHGADCNPKGYSDGYPLVLAVKQAHEEMIKLLLKYGADLNQASGSTGVAPIHVAAKHGHLDILKYLLDEDAEVDKKDNHGRTALYHAAHAGFADVVDTLLKNCADPNIITEENETPLIASIQEGRLETIQIVKLLIRSSCNVDQRGKYTGHPNGLYHAIEVAASEGYIPLIELIVAAGGDVRSVVQHWKLTEGEAPALTEDLWERLTQIAATPPALMQLVRVNVRKALINSLLPTSPKIFDKQIAMIGIPKSLKKYLLFKE